MADQSRDMGRERLTMERELVSILNKCIQENLILSFSDPKVYSPDYRTRGDTKVYDNWKIKVTVKYSNGPKMHALKFDLANAIASVSKTEVKDVQFIEMSDYGILTISLDGNPKG